MQRLSKIRKLSEVIAPIDGIPEFVQTAVKFPTKDLAGGIADHRDVHGDNIPLECRAAALLDGVPKPLPGLFTETVHPDDLIPMLIQAVNVQIAVNPAASNQLFQRSFRQSLNVHGLFAHKMDELFKAPGLAGGVVAEQGLDDPFLAVFTAATGFVDSGRLSAAGALVRDYGIHRKIAPVQVFLHMGNDHVSLAHQDTAARRQFQILNEGQVVQAGSGHFASVDLHRLKNGNRGNLAGAAGCPFNRLELCLEQIILKFEGKAVLVVMARAPAAFGQRDVVVSNNDTVDGNISVRRILLELTDTVLGFLLRQRALGDHVLAGQKAQRPQRLEALRLAGQFLHALQHIERHEHQSPSQAGPGVKQAH